jgi:hypothetical protein
VKDLAKSASSIDPIKYHSRFSLTGRSPGQQPIESRGAKISSERLNFEFAVNKVVLAHGLM